MRAELKGLESPDISDLENFRPNGPFGFLITAVVGPFDATGEETFDIFVCSPDWLAQNMTTDIKLGRHILFMKSYDFEVLSRFISSYCHDAQGDSWSAVAEKVARLGKWEFEDYRD